MTDSSPKNSRVALITALKWLVAIGLLAGLYWKCGKDLAELRERHILWGVFAIAFFVRVISLMATFVRWRMLVRGIGIPFSFRETFRLGMLGEACNMMGPGAVGGDLVKVALLAKDHPQRTASVFATVFLDRILGLWALFVLGAIASLIPVGTKLGSTMQLAVLALWGGSIAGVVGIGLMFVPAFTHSRLMHWLTTWKFVGKIVKELMDSIQLYQGKPQAVIYAALLGMVGHLGFLTVFFLCAQSLHQGRSYPGYVDHIVGLPIAETLAALIPTPGGIGPLEAGIALFYEEHQRSIDPNNKEMLTAAASNGLLTALGYRLTTWICGAIGIVYYFSSRKEISQAVHGADGADGVEPQVVT